VLTGASVGIATVGRTIAMVVGVFAVFVNPSLRIPTLVATSKTIAAKNKVATQPPIARRMGDTPCRAGAMPR
jgi:hypothetical protein